MASHDRSPGQTREHAFRHLTRRGFVGTTASAVGLALGMPARALGQNPHLDASPTPIPGGVSPFGVFIHHFPVPNPGTPVANLSEPSQITDFNGFVGANRVRGVGSSPQLGSLTFQVDMGFMVGSYVAADGKQYHDSFGFI